MQLSTPTASFDSGPLANLLAPGAPTPTTATTLPATPFADFMPAELPAGAPAPDLSTLSLAGTGLTPACAIDSYPLSDLTEESAPALCAVASPSPAGAGILGTAAATDAQHPEVPAEIAPSAPSLRDTLDATASTEPSIADGRPADLRPRHRSIATPARASRTVELKTSRPADLAPTPESTVMSLLSPVAPVAPELNPFASDRSCATPAEESLDSAEPSDAVGDAGNALGASPQFAPANDSLITPKVGPVAPENPTAVGSSPPPALPVAATSRSASGRVNVQRSPVLPETSPTTAAVVAQPSAVPAGKAPEVSASRVGPLAPTVGRTDIAAPTAFTPTDEVTKLGAVTPTIPAARRENMPATRGLAAPLSATVAPAVGAAARTQTDTTAAFEPVAEATASAALPMSAETPRSVWSGYLAQPSSAGAVVESVAAGQPMLRSRNFGVVSRPDSGPGPASINPAVRAGESITTALPTLASMLPPKAASAPSVSLPGSEVGQGEKTAAGTTEFSAELISDFRAEQLNFLTPAQQQVKTPVSELGIDVAETPSAMPATTSNRRSTAPAAAASDSAAVPAPHGEGERVMPAAAAPAFVAPTVAPAPVAPQPAAHVDQPVAVPATPAQVSAAAHRAVDAVLASTDRFTPVTQSSVDLQLSVGDAPLSVRVEVRAGVVHATFRTDSPELRTALAQEWQAASHQQSADQSLRLAPVVFANSDRASGDAGSTLAGQSFSQGRDPSSRSAPEFFSGGAARSQLAAALTAEPAATSTPSRRSTVDSSARLHAFA